jgi:hypothetical protein
VKIETTVSEAHDILDDLDQLDGEWSATHLLAEALRAIVQADPLDWCVRAHNADGTHK